MARLGQFKRDTLTNWKKNNPVLADGEFVLIASDETKPKKYDKWTCGDGINSFVNLLLLDYGYDWGGEGSFCLSGKGDSTQLPMSQKAVTELFNEGYLFAGMADLSTNPGVPKGKVFYIATEAGTYVNFGNLVVKNEDVTFLKYEGSASLGWTLTSTKIVVEHVVSIEELDTYFSETNNLLSLLLNKSTLNYRVVDNYEQNHFVGILQVFSDNMMHVLTQIFTTHYSNVQSGDFSVHTDGTIYTYFRSYSIASPSLTKQTWTSWKLINDSNFLEETRIPLSNLLIGKVFCQGIISYQDTPTEIGYYLVKDDEEDIVSICTYNEKEGLIQLLPKKGEIYTAESNLYKYNGLIFELVGERKIIFNGGTSDPYNYGEGKNVNCGISSTNLVFCKLLDCGNSKENI